MSTASSFLIIFWQSSFWWYILWRNISTGQKLSAKEIIQQVNTTELIFFIVPNPAFGQWRAVYSSQKLSMCIFNPNGVSNMYVEPGFLPVRNFQIAPLLDNPVSTITQGVPNFFVGHPNGLPCVGKITFLSIFENFGMVYQSNGQIRYHCAYEYYFGWIYCNAASVYYYKVNTVLIGALRSSSKCYIPLVFLC